MFRDIGIEELLVIFIIALLVFGASKLPKIGEDLGKAMRNFRDAVSGQSKDVKTEVDVAGALDSKDQKNRL